MIAETLEFQLARCKADEDLDGAGRLSSARKLDTTGQPQARTARLANRAGTPSARRGRDARQACKGNRLRTRRKLVDDGKTGRTRSGSWTCARSGWLQFGTRRRRGSGIPVQTFGLPDGTARRPRKRRAGTRTAVTPRNVMPARGRSDLCRAEPQGRRQVGTYRAGGAGDGAKRDRDREATANPGRAATRAMNAGPATVFARIAVTTVGWEPRRREASTQERRRGREPQEGSSFPGDRTAAVADDR